MPRGKTWCNGLQAVAIAKPEWVHPGEGTLPPFVMAAYDDMDTVFELLQFDATVLILIPESKILLKQSQQ